MAPACANNQSFSAKEKHALSAAAQQRFARKAAALLMRSSKLKHPEMA
jgi:hypothetical protein